LELSVTFFQRAKTYPVVGVTAVHVFIRLLSARIEERSLMQYVYPGYKVFIELGKYLLQRGVVIHASKGRVYLFGFRPHGINQAADLHGLVFPVQF